MRNSENELNKALIPQERSASIQDELRNQSFSRRQIFLTLFALSSCSFAIGTTEFVTTGLLPDLADDFSISIPVAGYVTSVYALAVGVGGPILTAATIRIPRKRVISGLMALFIVGSITSALAPTFPILMVGRILSAFCHGAFFGIASVVSVNIVDPSEAARAIAFMFTGLSLASVVGVPMGTLLGQTYGWRFPFWVIAGLGGVSLLGIIAFFPKKIVISATSIRQELAVFKRLSVWSALFTTALGFNGLITSFAYIAPIMTDVSGFSSNSISWLITIYGVGLVIGNAIGGKAADRALMTTIYSALTGLAIILGGFTFTAHYKIPSVITLFLLGTVGFSLVSPLQKYVLNKAEGAPSLAATANIAAFNLGTALGVYLGGLTIDAGFGYTSANWVGAMLTMTGLSIAIVSNLKRESLRNTEAKSNPVTHDTKSDIESALPPTKPKRVSVCNKIMSFFFGSRETAQNTSLQTGVGKSFS